MKLRILHLLSSSHLGGAEQMCIFLASAQIAAGDEVALHVFVDGKVAQAARAAGIPTTCPDAESHGRSLSRRRRWKTAAIRLRDAIREFRPDIVHSHVPLTNLMCHRIMTDFFVPWVATTHGSWKQFAYAPQTQDKPYLRLYLLLRHAMGDLLTARSAARIIAISDYVRRELLHIGVASNRIVRIHDGLPENHVPLSTEASRKRQGISPDVLVLGSLGFMAPVKGFDLLIRSIALLTPRHSQLLLLIAGGDVMGCGSVRRSLHRLVNDLRLEEHVRILDAVDPKEGFLSALDIYVVSSRTEGLSLSLLDAMKHGKPSVVTSAGGCVEAARPGLEGLVFKSGNVQSLAQTIERLLRDKSLRDSLGQAAAERVRSYLSLRRCVAEYKQLYCDVLASRHEK